MRIKSKHLKKWYETGLREIKALPGSFCVFGGISDPVFIESESDRHCAFGFDLLSAGSRKQQHDL